MMTDHAVQSKIDAYVDEIERALHSLSREQRRDIVEELKSHIREVAGGATLDAAQVTAALERLGRPQQLASMYLAENLTKRAEEERSPWLIVRACARWAKLSVTGVFVLLGCLVGYGFAAGWFLAAIAKPFRPDRIGLWHLVDPTDNLTFSLGAVDQPGARELLGWWLIPLGLALALLFAFLTTRFGLWGIRRFKRPSHP
jgi:hypothetical protein